MQRRVCSNILLLFIFISNSSPRQEGRTALHHAALSGCDEILTILLNSGADVNARDRDGFTALFLASMNGHRKCLSTLMAAGADPSIRDKQVRA
jgi:ankyrin repeat protein